MDVVLGIQKISLLLLLLFTLFSFTIIIIIIYPYYYYYPLLLLLPLRHQYVIWRQKWVGQRTQEQKQRQEWRDGCSLTAATDKTSISMIRATRACSWEQASCDSSTRLHLATSPNEHHGVAPRAVRSNWDHSWGSALRVKVTWNAREGSHYCFIMSSALIIQQTVD